MISETVGLRSPLGPNKLSSISLMNLRQHVRASWSSALTISLMYAGSMLGGSFAGVGDFGLAGSKVGGGWGDGFL